MDKRDRGIYGYLMETVLLKTLVVVYEVGSFTEAAGKLCVTQSAVSRRIQQLETHYGVTLIDREAEPITPTPEGRILISKARRMLALQEEMDEAVTGLKVRHHIRFCCTPCFGVTRLPDIFRMLVGAHDQDLDFNVTFRLSEDIVDGLLSGRYDLAAMEHCCELNLTSCSNYSLPADDMVFVSAPDLGIPRGQVSLKQLVPHRLFLKAQNGCAHRFLMKGMERMGEDVSAFTNLTYYDDLRGLLRQVCEGQGIGFVSKELVAEEAKAGLVKTHRLRGFDHMRSRSLVMPHRFRPTATASRFLQVFFTSFGLPLPPELG